MRVALLLIALTCSALYGLTFVAEEVMEEVSLCYSEVPDEYEFYQRRCVQEVLHDNFAATSLIAVYSMF